ncbi:MAG: adenosylhomocysteine nucleosidase [Methyloprofundus sp.]|nr:MAG: adenosylhomocysteine nucleosidase [Methyloprofundus sp.]
MITGIVVALPEELRTLSKVKLAQGECTQLSANTLVILAGTGSENAHKASLKLVAQGAQQLISWGCAGALAPYLKAGDLIIPSAILSQGNTSLTTHKHWREQLTNMLGQSLKCYNGQILESDTVISLAQDKTHQFQCSNALAVDMESAAIARIAAQTELPFIAIRSIVDSAQFDLPKAISYALNDDGIVAIPKLIKYLCLHPSELVALIQLGLHFKAASHTLKQLARQLPSITQAL